jgi:uncharacterized RDD family membrane protein YckC
VTRLESAPSRGEDTALEPRPETVLGLDNVPLELPVARVGSRVLAGLVDHLLLGGVLLAWALVAALVGAFLPLGPGWVMGGFLTGLFLIQHGFFAAQEVATGGRTVGKHLFGLRVVGRSGSAAPASALVIRNLLRIVDLLVGIPLMGVDPLARRVGDRLANTLVVHERSPRGELALGRLPPGWGADEARLVESFLLRAPELTPARRDELASRLAHWIEAQAPGFLEPPGSPHERIERAFRVEEW